MGKAIALLRAVNLGPHGKAPAAELRKLMAALSLEDGKTLLASGNLVFEAGGRSPAELETLLEAALAKQLGLKTAVMVRDAAAWAKIVEANPFPDAAKDDPSHLVVMPLKEKPSAGALDALRAAIKGREEAAVHGREAYLVYPDGIGTSKLTTKVIEAKLGTQGTGRNWNTALKLLDLVR